jgi:hypothetical protein
MKAHFVHGPYDGMDLELLTDLETLKAICDVCPVSTANGMRQFLIMPSPQDYGRILRGEITKDQSQGVRHPYERRNQPERVEYHYADKWIADAIRGRD